jgi:carbon monoxide dehydrogenase subunit G
MTKFESSVRQIDAPQQKIYDTLSNLENLEKVRDRIPEDKIDDICFDNDSISVRVNPVGMVKFKIIEREEPKTIKFEAEGSPVPVNFWIQILPVEETTAKMKLTIKADIPFFMKGMV